MLISIIVPFYNAASSLRCTINCLLKQSLKDFEIILVDDGSQDNGLSIAQEISQTDHRLVVVHQENGGVSSARNSGLRISQGQYIAFVDADDSVDDKMYGELVAKMQEKDADIGVSGYCINGKAVCDLRKHDYVFGSPEQIHKEFIIDMLGGPGSIFPVTASVGRFVYKKDLLSTHNILFNTQIGYHEDFVFGLSALTRANRIYLDGRPFYNYSYNEIGRGVRHKLEKKIASHRHVINFLSQMKSSDCFGMSDNYASKIIFFNGTICENICKMEENSIYKRIKMLRMLYFESKSFLEECHSGKCLHPKY
ncbi:MAG: hypothetical protein C0403_16000, partial [Desulfobacterium sp.]|nr:hypothetical protein [Desulfobacterium sp.]